MASKPSRFTIRFHPKAGSKPGMRSQPLPTKVSAKAPFSILKRLKDADSGALLATVRSVLFLRGDGGCGSFGHVPTEPTPLASETIAQARDITTLPQAALIYLLSGDDNPIHADPAAAAQAGFERPTL